MWLPELWINLSFEYAIVKLEPRPAAEILGFGGTIILWQWHTIIAFSAVDSDRQHSNGTMDGDTTILAFVFFSSFVGHSLDSSHLASVWLNSIKSPHSRKEESHQETVAADER